MVNSDSVYADDFRADDFIYWIRGSGISPSTGLDSQRLYVDLSSEITYYQDNYSVSSCTEEIQSGEFVHYGSPQEVKGPITGRLLSKGAGVTPSRGTMSIFDPDDLSSPLHVATVDTQGNFAFQSVPAFRSGGVEAELSEASYVLRATDVQATGEIAVHGSDSCETSAADAVDVGSSSSYDDILRQGSCLYSDVNPSSSGQGDTIRLTTIAGNNTDDNMSGFASCINCGAPWQGSGTYMGVDRAPCNATLCAYHIICEMPGLDCIGNYCDGTYFHSVGACTGSPSAWNSRFYIR